MMKLDGLWQRLISSNKTLAHLVQRLLLDKTQGHLARQVSYFQIQ